jgi:hypothetical protein
MDVGGLECGVGVGKCQQDQGNIILRNNFFFILQERNLLTTIVFKSKKLKTWVR